MKNPVPTPYQLVAKALEISESDLHPNSAFGETPNWDSLNHLMLIDSMEKNYEVTIANDEIEKYNNMAAIESLYRTAILRK
ncbi:MAG: hypothetical protein ABI378_09380 [Chitinophagaceae bacterium]